MAWAVVLEESFHACVKEISPPAGRVLHTWLSHLSTLAMKCYLNNYKAERDPWGEGALSVLYSDENAHQGL